MRATKMQSVCSMQRGSWKVGLGGRRPESDRPRGRRNRKHSERVRRNRVTEALASGPHCRHMRQANPRFALKARTRGLLSERD